MIRRFATFALFTLACAALVKPGVVEAQRPSVSVRMSTDTSDLSVGQPFELRIEIVAEGSSIEDVALPDLSGFDVAARRTSQPMEFGFGPNGRPVMRSSLIHDLTLVPRHGGAFSLRPVRVRAGGRTFESDPLVLKVLGADATPDSPDVVGPPDANGDDLHVDASFDPQAFVAASIDRRSVYVGQPVLVTYYLYQRVDGQPTQSRSASADGFWVHDLLTPQMESQSTVETVRRVQFRVRVVGRFVAFPLRSGSLGIEPPQITLQPAFAGFGFGGAITRTAPRLTVEVKPLPPPVPAGVAVGRFDLAATLDPARLRTGEATTLTVTIRGEGSLRDVTPAPPAIPGVRVDPPTIEDHVSVARDLVGAERVLRYLLVPSAPGELAIPKIGLATFDPIDEAYRTLETPPLTMHVTGATLPSDTNAREDRPEAEETDARRSTIEFGPIRRESAFERRRALLSRAPFYPFALFVPLFLFLSALGARTLVGARAASQGGKRTTRTSSKKLLEESRTLATRGDARAFYGSIARALRTAIEVRVARSTGSLTHPELRAYLARRGMPDELVGRLVDELEGSDFARFSSVGGAPEEMQRCLDRVAALVDRLARFEPTPEEAS